MSTHESTDKMRKINRPFWVVFAINTLCSGYCNQTHPAKVLSFLDAYMSCYPSKQGFSVDGEYIRCRTCDVRYSLSEIEKGFGGCSPIRIHGRLQGGEYHIPVSRLEASADKFYKRDLRLILFNICLGYLCSLKQGTFYESMSQGGKNERSTDSQSCL